MIPRPMTASRWFSSEETEDGAVGQEAHPGVATATASDGSNEPLLESVGGWQLHRASGCRGRKLEGLERGSSARLWLLSLKKDPFAMTAMRTVLVEEGLSFPESRLRDDDVIDQVANLLSRGVWHVCEPMRRLFPIRVVPASESAFVPVPRRGTAPSQSYSTAPPPPELPAPPTLSKNADQAAIAAVLAGASQSGVPFCEECAKAAAARAAAAT